MIEFQHVSWADSEVTLYPDILSVNKFYFGSKEFIQEYHDAQKVVWEELRKYVPERVLSILGLSQELHECSHYQTWVPYIVSQPQYIHGETVSLDEVKKILTEYRVPWALTRLILSSLMSVNIKKVDDRQIVVTDIAFSLPVFLYIDYQIYLWMSWKKIPSFLKRFLKNEA